MREMTTVKVSVGTRDALKRLAERQGLTMDAQLEEMIRRERRRQIGQQLASGHLDETDRLVLDASVGDVDHASR